ncbi:hypothetical protein GCM10023310_25600 [Paenibacillus vulneris]|uniref:Spore germination protein n=1 Tax=Paenibacillus vulneris TaxID=1133364 RepID=A0ABW3US58_9BACL
MPALVGVINVNMITGVFNVGDAGIISPSTFSTTYAGGGSFNSGNTLNIHNEPTVINVYDSAVYEQRSLTAAPSITSIHEEGQTS